MLPPSVCWCAADVWCCCHHHQRYYFVDVSIARQSAEWVNVVLMSLPQSSYPHLYIYIDVYVCVNNSTNCLYFPFSSVLQTFVMLFVVSFKLTSICPPPLSVLIMLLFICFFRPLHMNGFVLEKTQDLSWIKWNYTLELFFRF